MKFIFGIIGAYIGALVDSFSGFCFGAAIGLIIAYIIELKKHLQVLEEKLSTIQSTLIGSNVNVDQTSSRNIYVDETDIELEETSVSDEVVDSEEVTQISHATEKATVDIGSITTPQSSSWEEADTGGP